MKTAPKESLEDWLKAEWARFVDGVWQRVERYVQDRTLLSKDDLNAELKRFRDEVLGEAQRRVEFTQEWYGTRIRVLGDWARKHGHELVKRTVADMYAETGDPLEYFAIMANGLPSIGSHPTYAQSLNMMRHRAEKAEAEIAKLKAELASANSSVQSYSGLVARNEEMRLRWQAEDQQRLAEGALREQQLKAALELADGSHIHASDCETPTAESTSGSCPGCGANFSRRSKVLAALKL